jgi:S-(hydroxymethyl)glutathione dehydrogenase/alcohol dehydrogenase
MKEMEVKEVPDAVLQKKDDIIVKITSTAICGSDLHIYQGALPAEKDYVVGHERWGLWRKPGQK